MGKSTSTPESGKTTPAPAVKCTLDDAQAIARSNDLWPAVSSCYHEWSGRLCFQESKFDTCLRSTAPLTPPCESCFSAMGLHYHRHCKKACKDDGNGCDTGCHNCMEPAFDEITTCVGDDVRLPAFTPCSSVV